MALFDHRARLSRGYDGDSFWVLGDTGYGQRYEPELRLYDVYMPELHEAGGPEMRAVVADWFTAADKSRLEWPIWVVPLKTKLVEPKQKLTFTRYLATVYACDGKGPVGSSLNEYVNATLAANPQWGHGKGQPK